MNGPILLRTRGLSAGHGGQAILPPIDLTVRRGELWGVVGRNGAGKTTLLRTLLGLHRPVAGSSELPGGTVIGYVPQRHLIDPLVPARARDLIAEGAEHGFSFLSPVLGAERRGRIARAVAATGSAAFLDRHFRDLSEGEKQKVLIARALASAPDLLVLDEPTSAMDVVANREAIEVLKALRDGSDLGILLVSHQLGVVVSVADRILFVDAELGLAVTGTPGELLAHPVFAERYGAVLPSGPGAAS